MADPTGARDDARRILEGDRYQARDVPRPLQGVLRWIGDRLHALGEPLADLLSTPGGIAVAVTVVVLVAGALALATARRRTRTHERATTARRRSHRPDPSRLEHEAEEAEGRGELAAAVRLRFRAGILRLEDAGVVPVRPDTTTRRLVAAVPSAALPALAATFDEVAYGRRRAGPEDVAAARRDWPGVVADAEHAARAAEADRAAAEVAR